MTAVDPAGAEVDIAALQLDVYDTRQGWWNPEHGDVDIPNGWGYLPTGDAFLTRTVKADGIYWLCWLPRSRNHAHRRLQGLWAPAATIRTAEERATRPQRNEPRPAHSPNDRELARSSATRTTYARPS